MKMQKKIKNYQLYLLLIVSISVLFDLLMHFIRVDNDYIARVFILGFVVFMFGKKKESKNERE